MSELQLYTYDGEKWVSQQQAEDIISELRARIAELERDADGARDLLVTAEWLRDMGFKNGGGFCLYLNIGCSVAALPHQLRCSDSHNADNTPWEFWSYPDELEPVGVMIAEEIPTRGRVLDLLSGLGVPRQSIDAASKGERDE